MPNSNLENEKIDIKKEKNNWNLATLVTAMILFLMTVVFVILYYYGKNKCDSCNTLSTVKFITSDSSLIISDVSWFYHDQEKKLLVSSKIITEKDRIHLKNLLNCSIDKDKYENAIDKLAFTSNENTDYYYLFSLVLAMICAMIGVHLKTLFDFVGHTCHQNDFDYKKWWPWYVIRPLIGALIGPIVYIMLDGNFISPYQNSDISQKALVALTILAGFGSDDFLNMLRRLSKRIFGTADNQSEK